MLSQHEYRLAQTLSTFVLLLRKRDQLGTSAMARDLCVGGSNDRSVKNNTVFDTLILLFETSRTGSFSASRSLVPLTG